METTSEILAPTLLILTLASFTQSTQYCPLVWEAAGSGELPMWAIPVSSEKSADLDYIARTFFHSNWVIGHLNSSIGLTSFASEQSVYLVETFQVLTNPHNCILTWSRTSGGNVQDFSVRSAGEEPLEDVRNPTYYVGRVLHQRKYYAGNVIPPDSGIHIASHGKPLLRNHYEILLSTYPSLFLDLTDFVFDIGLPDFGALEEKFTKLELVGEDVIYNSVAAQTQHRLAHSKSFLQSIILMEEHDWSDIGNITMRLSLWFGNEDIQADTTITPGMKRWRITRNQTVKLEQEITVKGHHNIQVCSIAAMLENPVISYTASGTFYHPHLSAHQIATILKERGRLVLDQEGDRVIARVRGELSGRYFLRTFSHVLEKEKQASCLSLFSKWARTY